MKTGGKRWRKSWWRRGMKELNLKTIYENGKVRGARIFDGEKLLGWVDYPELEDGPWGKLLIRWADDGPPTVSVLVGNVCVAVLTANDVVKTVDYITKVARL